MDAGRDGARAPRDGMVRVSVRVRDLRVSTKLFAGFGVVTALLVIISVLAVLRLSEAQTRWTLSSSGIASVDGIDKVQTAYLQVRKDLSDIAVAVDPPRRTDAHRPDDAGPDRVGLGLADLPGVRPAPQSADQEKYTQGVAQWRSAVQALLPLAQNSDLTAFVAQRAATTTAVGKDINAALDAMNDAEAASAKQMAADGRTAYRQAVGVLVGCTVLAVLLAAAVSVRLARSIARPLDRVVTVVGGAGPSVAWTSGWTTTVATRWVAWRRRRTRVLGVPVRRDAGGDRQRHQPGRVQRGADDRGDPVVVRGPRSRRRSRRWSPPPPSRSVPASAPWRPPGSR